MYVQPPSQERNLVKWAGSAGMFVLLSRGVNCWFWYQVRCSRDNANFIFHTGIVKKCPWRNNKGRNQLERIKTFLSYALGKKCPQQVFHIFIISQTQIWMPMETSVFLSETIQPCICLYINLWSQNINCYKMILHKILSALVSSVLTRWIKQSLNFSTDSLQCPDDYQCGNNSICVVDPLFPQTPVCKCLKGYKMSSEGKCEGML